MMTVITETTLQSGREAEWDAAFQERLADARQQPGWVGMELLVPENEPAKRLVIGTWRGREDWERWHGTDAFRRTRERMDAVTASDGDERWFRVITETF